MRLSGTPGAPGAAVGPAWRFPPPSPAPSPDEAPDGLTIAEAAERAAADLWALADRVRAAGRDDDAGIFEAQALMATDPAVTGEADRRAREAGASGPAELSAAVEAAAGAAADTLAALDDELLAARAADVRDVGARIGRILRGETIAPPARPSVAIADDLPPSVTAELPPGSLLGIALEGGSRTAHAVILARGLGIPAVVGVSGLLAAADAAADAPVEVALDGGAGEVVLAPTPADVEAMTARAAAIAAVTSRAASLRGSPAATLDGARVHLVANIGRPEDADRAIAAGAEGVGLFRTEFVFMGRSTPPSEREQTDAYRRVFAAFGPYRPVTVRLADIGGDKEIPYLGLPPEQNPFLGVRALRLAYRGRELLVTQLRSISAAAALAGVEPHVMAPMVATLEDVALLRSLVDEAQAGLATEGRPRAERLVLGIMVEVPSAAFMAAELAGLVDFFSVGTNDLTQYLLAADRTNAALGGLQDALHPAVLRAIARVVEGADGAGIPVAVCGELAGEPAGALVLVGIGVDELSADAGSLDLVRLALAGSTRADLVELGQGALRATDAPAVRALAGAAVERAMARTPPS